MEYYAVVKKEWSGTTDKEKLLNILKSEKVQNKRYTTRKK